MLPKSLCCNRTHASVRESKGQRRDLPESGVSICLQLLQLRHCTDPIAGHVRGCHNDVSDTLMLTDHILKLPIAAIPSAPSTLNNHGSTARPSCCQLGDAAGASGARMCRRAPR